MPRLAWHLEEPRVGQSYPNFYAAQLASKFVKVVLSGAGGDELFGGYPWRYYRAACRHNFEHYVDQYYGFWQRLVPTIATAQHAGADLGRREACLDPRHLPRRLSQARRRSSTDPRTTSTTRLYFEAKTFLHGLLVVEDKLSMAHGLETRVPFLDNDLVDFAMRVPVGLKLGNLSDSCASTRTSPATRREQYFLKTSDGKLILRDDDGPLHSAGHRRRRQAGLLGARCQLVQGREHRLRAQRCSMASRGSTPFSTVRPCVGSSTSTLPASKIGDCSSGPC